MKTVRDFIEELLLLDPDMPLFVSGYEYGFDLPAKLRCVKITANSSPKDYLGRFLLASGSRADPNAQAFAAYVVPRPGTMEFSDQEAEEK